MRETSHRTIWRRGAVLAEALVAAVVLASVMALIGPLAVRQGQLWQHARRSQAALDELSNQLDRLASLPEGERTAALLELEPSKFARQALPEPELTAALTRQDDLERLTLRLSWAQPAGRSRPLSLAAWWSARGEEESP